MLPEYVVEGEVDIAERSLAVGIGAVLGKPPEQPVGICGASSDKERGRALAERALEVETACYQADSKRALHFLHVPRLTVHL